MTLPPRKEVEAAPTSAKHEEPLELEASSLPTAKERWSTHEAEETLEEPPQEV